jgi:hypothetical protein
MIRHIIDFDQYIQSFDKKSFGNFKTQVSELWESIIELNKAALVSYRDRIFVPLIILKSLI